MTNVLSWFITALVLAVLLAFLVSLVSLRRLPVGERPRTRTYDRFGRVIELAENPDFHEQPGEQSAEALKLQPNRQPATQPPAK